MSVTTPFHIDFIVLHVPAHIQASSGKKILKKSCLVKYIAYVTIFIFMLQSQITNHRKHITSQNI